MTDRSAASARPTRRLMANGGGVPAVVMSTVVAAADGQRHRPRQREHGHEGEDQRRDQIGGTSLVFAQKAESEGPAEPDDDEEEGAYHFRSLKSEMSRLRPLQNSW